MRGEFEQMAAGINAGQRIMRASVVHGKRFFKFMMSDFKRFLGLEQFGFSLFARSDITILCHISPKFAIRIHDWDAACFQDNSVPILVDIFVFKVQKWTMLGKYSGKNI